MPTEQEKFKIFQDVHRKPVAGHLGMNKTYERIKLFIIWPGMKQEREDYIKKCEICQKNKITQHKVKMPLQINTTPHSSTGFTPHELLFGRKPNIPGILQKETPEIQYTFDNYVKELQDRLQSSYEIARSNLQVKKEKSKECYDRTVNVPLFVIGDKVLLHDETVRRGRSSKLSQSWVGPYEIISLDDVNVTLKLPRNRTLKVHANRLKPFFG